MEYVAQSRDYTFLDIWGKYRINFLHSKFMNLLIYLASYIVMQIYNLKINEDSFILV